MNINSPIVTQSTEGPHFDPTAVMEFEMMTASGHYVHYRAGMVETLSLFGTTYRSCDVTFSLYDVLCSFIGISVSTLNRIIDNIINQWNDCPHGHPNDFI